MTTKHQEIIRFIIGAQIALLEHIETSSNNAKKELVRFLEIALKEAKKLD